jgi:hypothetical protein
MEDCGLDFVSLLGIFERKAFSEERDVSKGALNGVCTEKVSGITVLFVEETGFRTSVGGDGRLLAYPEC